MAEDVTAPDETLTGALTLLVNLSEALLENGKQEAEGRTSDGLRSKLQPFSAFSS